MKRIPRTGSGRLSARISTEPGSDPGPAARARGLLGLQVGLVSLGLVAWELVGQDLAEVLWSRPAGTAAPLAFSADGQWLAVANAGVQFWQVAHGSPAGTISGAFGGITSIASSRDGLRVAVGDADGVIRVYNVWDRSAAWSCRAGGDVTGVTYGPTGMLSSWSSDRNTVDLWRADDGVFQRSLSGYEWSHYNVAFSPDGTLVAIGGDTDPAVKLLSVADGSVVRTLVGHTARVRTVAFSTDGAALATAGDDGSIRLWRVSDGAQLRMLSGHTAAVWKLAVAPNATLASSGTDGTLRLWRMTDGALLRTFATAPGGSLSLEFSPDGSVFAFETNDVVVVARDPVPAITSQPTRLTRFAGQIAEFSVTATGDAPLAYQWRRDGAPLTGSTNATLPLANLGLANAGAYTVEVSNLLGMIVSQAADLNVLPCPTGPGSLDVSFDPSAGGAQLDFAGGVPGVQALLLDPDGRILIGGEFAAANGTVRRRLARLHQDGTVDPSFHPGLGLDGEVTAMARQPDGAIVVAGVFTAADGQRRGQVARLDTKGAVDPGFRVTLAGSTWMSVTYPTSVAVQKDGHVWVCGSFSEVNGAPCSHVARLNPDGTLDPNFHLDDVAPQGTQWVDRVFVQDDGDVILGGCWTNPACSLVRLNFYGNPDASFLCPKATGFDANSPGHIEDLATHLDGRIAIVGDFRTVNGVTRNGVAWLQPNGALDLTFDPGSGAEDSTARRVVIEPDGRVVIGGWFMRVRGAERRGFARFNPDGTLDSAFDPGLAVGHTARPNVNALVRQSDGRYLVGADDWFREGTNCVLRLEPGGGRDPGLQVALQLEPYANRTAAVQPDGRVLVAGSFTSLNGIARPGLARLEQNGLLDSTFAPASDLDLEVWAIAVQSDRRIVVGGLSKRFGGGPGVFRLEADGRMDPGFAGPQVAGPARFVETITLQPDGRILIGGVFTSVGDRSRWGIARLNTDGSVDEGFQPPTFILSDDPGYGMEHIRVLPDQRILVAGGFSSGSETLHSIARLQADGSLDPSFVPALPEQRPIKALAVQSDGRILLAAEFTTGTNWGRLLRLMPDGAADPTFQPEAAAGITALALLPDGRILVATNSSPSGAVLRLRPDGTRDALWQTALGAGQSYPGTTAMLLQPDGRVILTGVWQSVGGVPRPGIARLNSDASACFLRARDQPGSEGYFHLEFTGIAGGRYLIETSDDLRAWLPWILLDNPVSPLDLLDPTAGGANQRFYRARLVP
jgi:uncharacterized delta-60 repeat protein